MDNENATERQTEIALPSFLDFTKQLEQEKDPEKKIRMSIDFMRAALSQGGHPRFKDFWEVRKICLPLFKENISQPARATLWAEYVELSQEARRVKEILDEQSAFAVEQIELAANAIESDLNNFENQLAQMHSLDFPEEAHAISSHFKEYDDLQREINLLNTFAARINALRKEVIKTDMRVRFKTKFFENLSLLGDRIFPRRKELIKLISNQFLADVENFVNSHFQEEKRGPLFPLREEIKALQMIAKMLTLNTQAFTDTRLSLSKCWDVLKSWDKERKKEMTQKKQVYKQNVDVIMQKIAELEEICKNPDVAEALVRAKSEEIFDEMKNSLLGRDEVKFLQSEMQRAKAPFLDKIENAEKERLEKRQNSEREKREKKEQLHQDLTKLLAEIDAYEMSQVIERRDEILSRLEAMALIKSEKMIYDRLLKQLKDAISDKKDRVLMTLSKEELQSLEHLKTVLQERKQRRQEIKDQLENYRKAHGGSGFDFEKAMMYRELIDAEKARLEKATADIEEIEEKIQHLEG